MEKTTLDSLNHHLPPHDKGGVGWIESNEGAAETTDCVGRDTNHVGLRQPLSRHCPAAY
jgi:hypothetical protein